MEWAAFAQGPPQGSGHPCCATPTGWPRQPGL